MKIKRLNQMNILKDENNVGKMITLFYFVISGIEVLSEFFIDKQMLYIFKPSMTLMLMVLYWNTSDVRNPLFFVLFLFSLITNILFIPNTKEMLFFGIITFLIYRLLMIYYIIKLTKLKDFIPLLIAVVPFLFVFFYMFSISTEIPTDSFYILIVQNVLASILGAIAFSDHIMNNYKNNSWLLICGLLSVSHYFIIFIEKYYLSFSSQTVFRPLAMVLNMVIYYTFYRFVLESEKLYDN